MKLPGGEWPLVVFGEGPNPLPGPGGACKRAPVAYKPLSAHKKKLSTYVGLHIEGLVPACSLETQPPNSP